MNRQSLVFAVVIVLGLAAGVLVALLRSDPAPIDPAAPPAEPTSVDPRDPASVQRQEVVEDAAGATAWTIAAIDPAGAPVAGAAVTSVAGEPLGQTDSEGRLEVATSIAAVAVSMAPFVPATAAQNAAMPSAEVVVRLAPGLELSGVVIDQDGRPLPRTLVEIAIGPNRFAAHDWEPERNRPDGTSYEHVHGLAAERSYVARGLTDLAGRFSLAGIARTVVCLRATRPGYLQANVVHDEALLDAQTFDLSKQPPAEAIEVVMRRIYLGAVAVHAPPGVDPGAARNFVGVGSSAPPGLQEYGLSQRRAQVEARVEELERDYPILLTNLYLAAPGSNLASQVQTQWTLGLPTGMEPLTMALTPLDLFDQGSIVHAELTELPELIEVRLEHDRPVRLVALVENFPRARFRASRVEGPHQVFHVPAGRYVVEPVLSMLTNWMSRAEPFEVTAPLTRKPKGLDGFAELRVEVTDHLGRRVDDYSLVIRGAYGEAIYTGEGGWTQSFPCEAGEYHVKVRNRSMTLVAEGLATCTAGESTVLRLIGR